MALFYQQNINEVTRLAVWEITEPASFFLQAVPPHRDITHPHKRLQHLAGRFLLPYLFPDFPHTSIAIADTRKPFLPNEEYHFSISHCGHYAAAIVSANNRVGVDVELRTPRVHKIRHKFLHASEQEMVNGSNLDATTLLTLLWSAKEAMFKWWGYGNVDFSEHLRVLDLPTGLDGQMKAVFQNEDVHAPLTLHYRVMGELCLVWV